jgi:hypothetical protein
MQMSIGLGWALALISVCLNGATALATTAPSTRTQTALYRTATDCSFGVVASFTLPPLGVCMDVTRYGLMYRSENVTAHSLIRSFDKGLNYSIITYSTTPNCTALVHCCIDFEYCSRSQIILAGGSRVNSVRVVSSDSDVGAPTQ